MPNLNRMNVEALLSLRDQIDKRLLDDDTMQVLNIGNLYKIQAPLAYITSPPLIVPQSFSSSA